MYNCIIDYNCVCLYSPAGDWKLFQSASRVMGDRRTGHRQAHGRWNKLKNPSGSSTPRKFFEFGSQNWPEITLRKHGSFHGLARDAQLGSSPEKSIAETCVSTTRPVWNHLWNSLFWSPILIRTDLQCVQCVRSRLRLEQTQPHILWSTFLTGCFTKL